MVPAPDTASAVYDTRKEIAVRARFIVGFDVYACMPALMPG